MAPIDDDGQVAFPNGNAIPARYAIGRMRSTGDDAIRWTDDNRAIFMPDVRRWEPASDEPDYFAPVQPVAAAIVTSALGVLVGRRNDRTPPWGFISGEVEPGELPEDAAVREVKEETGLEVRAGEVIGERDHPATGRHMIYLAAKPTRGVDVFVGDEAELAEVRWADLDEADELLPGMFGPVREYLARELGEA
jgi:8-oxo-dGTP diphosphatase